MPVTDSGGFRFGLEAEFLLVEAATFRPLWHPDLRFEDLNAILETVAFDDLPLAPGDRPPPRRRHHRLVSARALHPRRAAPPH